MLDFRLYEPGDFAGCLDLIREGHDADFSEERFRWLHEKGPTGPSKIAVCLRDTKIVGVYSVLPKTVQFAGETYCGGRDVDPVVHPSFRGQGVFSRLLDFGVSHFQGLDFYFNFANPASAAGFRKQGWLDVMPLEDRVCQLGFRSPLSRAGLLWACGRIVRPAPGACRTSTLTTEGFQNFLETDTRFAGSGKLSSRGGVLRTTAYLSWRYLDHPLHKYKYYLAEDDAGKAALAVCRYDEAADRLTVVDLAGFGIKPRLASWLPLWREQFPQASVVVWHPLPRKTLAGFIGNPASRSKGRPFLVRESPSGKTPPGFLEGRNWFITRGDLEIA